MNILGIGPGEFVLVLIILLLVVGPERLPQFARQAGQMLVRVRNWIQKSPDAAMVMRARQEIEQELASLRLSLAEVQNVRDEVMEAAKQISQTVNEDVIGEVKLGVEELKQELEEVKGAPGTIGRTRNGQAVSVPDPAAASTTDVEAVLLDEQVVTAEAIQPGEQTTNVEAARLNKELPALELPSLDDPLPVDEALPEEQTVASPQPALTVEPEPAVVASTNGVAGTSHEQAGASAAEVAALRQQIQSLAIDLISLRKVLAQRGLLDDVPEPAPKALDEFEAPVPVEAEERV